MHHDQPDSCSAAGTRTTGMAQQGNSNVLQGFSASMDLSITGGICPQLPATHSRHAAQVLLASLCCYNKMAFALKSAQTVSTAFAGRRVTKVKQRQTLVCRQFRSMSVLPIRVTARRVARESIDRPHWAGEVLSSAILCRLLPGASWHVDTAQTGHCGTLETQLQHTWMARE